jgi:hypothetical protein
MPFEFDKEGKDETPRIDDDAFASIQDFFKKKIEGTQN